jgi:FkbM family methyltransferase
MLDRTVAVIRRLLGEDTARGQFVDVGANIGTETVPALLRHGFSAAVCVEPDPNNHRLLRSNLVLNAVDDKAVALQMGASDHCGASTLARVPQSGGNSYIVVDVDAWHELHAQKPATSPATGNGSAAPRTPVERGHSGEELTSVEITTLDALADQEIIDPEKAGLLWIDAEGHEGHVLAGATCLTGRGTPILVEYFPESIAIRGDLERFDAVLDQYTHFIDIRRRAAAKTASHRLRPISEMPTVTASLRDPEQSGFTDLLLLRLDEHQAARGSDVRAVLTRLG